LIGEFFLDEANMLCGEGIDGYSLNGFNPWERQFYGFLFFLQKNKVIIL
jgi:hypothetical protein